MSTTVEITIRRLPDASLVAELRVELPHSRADLGGAPVTISVEALRGLELLPDAYGAALTAMALPPALHPAWAKACGQAEGAGSGLHVRVAIADPSGAVRAPLVGALHAIRWELLRDPITNTPLATQEGGSLARLVVLTDLHDAAPPPKPALRALIAVAGPSDADRWGLAPVAVAAEAGRALEALGNIPADLLAHGHPHSSGRATLANVRSGLRKPAHLLALIAHGQATEAGSVLYLEGDDGSAAPITGADLAEAIGALAPASRPLLAVLVACEGADQAAAPLASVGPLLACAGVPAVIAMQTQVSMAAAAHFTARLLRELERDGRIDRALAAARAEMDHEWWSPVLWLRSRDGRLWDVPPPAQLPASGGLHIAGNVETVQVINIAGGMAGAQPTYESAPPPPPDPAADLHRRLDAHRAALAHYLTQLAITGSARVGPEVIFGIREARAGIRQAKAVLREMGVAVADHPDDESGR